jgi:nucleoside-diphosphate-sugar epimerase
MKILVIGGNGYVGSNYIQELVKRGLNGKDIDIYDLPSSILMEGILEHEIKQHDLIVHFAAVADLYESAKDYDKNFEVNVKGTYNVAKFCAKHKKFLIYISTCCVYGESPDYVYQKEIDEISTPFTNELYASTKLAGENIIRGIPELDYTILRIGTNYGVGQRESLFTYIVLDKIHNKQKIQVHGDGNQTRNLIYIDDISYGIYLVTKDFVVNYKEAKANGEIFNICGRESISVWDCIKTAEKIIGRSAMYDLVPDRQGQIQKEKISIKKMTGYYGFEPTISFEKGMEFAYYNDKRFK